MKRDNRILNASIFVFIVVLISSIVSRLVSNNPILTQEKTYQYLPVIAGIGGPIEYIAIGLSILLFAVIIGALYTISKKNNLYKYFLILFVLSPATIYSVLNPSPLIIAFVIAVVGGILLAYNKPKLGTIVLLGLLLFESKIGLFFAFVILLLYVKTQNKLFKKAFTLIFAGVILRGIYARDILFQEKNLISPFISFIQEFGTPQGISLVVLVFALIGFVLFWSKKGYRELIFVAITIISLYLESIFLFNLIAIYFASKVMEYLANTKWKIKTFRYGSILILLLIIANSLFIFSSGYAIQGPLEEDVKDYESLRVFNGTFLQDFENGDSFEYFSGNKAFAKLRNDIDVKVSQQIFYSTKLDYTIELLTSNDIKYIFVNEEMIEKYWEGKEKGLLIMVSNTEYFDKVYDSKGLRVYEVLTS